jgi:hypothetical protein
MDVGGKGAGSSQQMRQNSKAEGQSGRGNSGSISKEVPKIHCLLSIFSCQGRRAQNLLPTRVLGSQHSERAWTFLCRPIMVASG